MNIFILDLDQTKCAQYHLDKHIVKMPLETAQILCTVRHLHGENAPYKATHKNHPSTKWTCFSESYDWLCELGLQLCKEYTFRYDKRHKCQDIIEDCIKNKPQLESGFPTFALAMPDKYKTNDPVESYRNYYIGEKHDIAKWTKRERPDWYIL